MRAIGLAAVTLQGFIDAIERGVVYGWAWNPQRPEDHVEVEILHGGDVLGTVTADQFRDDLVDLEIGDGRHAFVFNLPDSLVGVVDGAEVEVRFANSTIPLPRMQVRPEARKRPDGPPRSDAERIAALRARIAMQEQVIADMSNVMNGLVDRIRNLPTLDRENMDDLEAGALASEMARQTAILESLEVYMTTFGQSLREISDRTDPAETAVARPASRFRSMDAFFLAVMTAMAAAFAVIFGGFY